ncbi:DUF2334 domain-containing protein [Clostridium perfringens]|uniref:DUF2334 domain-containing protein n=1 Tax=Clostridium perfringens TaxID=1502 RepID=UPI0018E4351D|nr:DUF2334 domain-containing protein [Clostridium perfringens]MBI5997589.1 DUF2334 domain-containing protein [Clostridium perfringens]
MLKFIIRLDDACENMKEDNWIKIEKILDKYNIKPIVGIIPDNRDKEFVYGIIKNFWEKYPIRWQEKNWIIAQHGLHHNLSKTIRTEYKGKTYEEQKENLKVGNKILKDNGINPRCFFAPAHTFDNNTIKACKDLNYFDFISDGYAFYPYLDKGMFFVPSIFDTPHKIFPFGIYTFVYHPNNMKKSDFENLEKFIKKHKKEFNLDYDKILEKYSNRKRNIFDKMLYILISLFRKVRGKNE